MADVQSRPSHRTSRGGYHSSRGRSSYTSRGSAPSSRSNATALSDDISSEPATMSSSASVDDTIQSLKAQYSAGLELLSELFPDWSEEDLLYLLSETSGDVEIAVTRITEGHASQWGEVKKKSKERSKSKGPFTSSEYARPSGSASTRGRSRGGFESRGRGRSDRGRSRGGKPNGRAGHEYTEDSTPSLPTLAPETSISSWGEPASASDNATGGDLSSAWGDNPVTTNTSSWDTTATTIENEPLAVTRNGTNGWDTTSTVTETTNGWGSTASTAPATSDKPVTSVASAPKPTSSVIKPGTKMSWASIAKPTAEKSEPPKLQAAPAQEPAPAVPAASAWGDVPTADTSFSNNDFATSAEEPEWNTPAPPAPDDFADTAATAPLTYENVDKVINDAPPPPSSSLASNIDSSTAPSISTSSSTPAPSKLPPGLSAKNIPAGGRSPAYSRILNQDAPVVMPGSVQAQVERAGLQFGSLNLSDAPDEESFETPKEQLDTPSASQKATPTYQQPQDVQPVDTASLAQSAPSQVSAQGLSGFGQPAIQASRYAQPQQAPIQPQAQQKGFEPFSQSPYGAYPTQTHIPGFGGFPSDYQNPYGADPQRQGYNYYPYQQQAVTTAAAQDSLQRTASTTLEQLTPSSASTQPTRFGVGSEPSQTSPAPTASPGMSAQHNQYGIHPYYLSPAYTAYYMNNMNSYQGYYAHQQTQPQFNQQKSLYGQQQSPFYGDHYSRAQQLQQQQQQQVSQQSQPVQQSTQTPQQASVSSLGGIPDFLQRDDASKAAGGNVRPTSSAGQTPQQQPQQQPSQIPPQQQQQQQPIPQQQNMYGGFSGYAPYGMSQQARQGGWGGYGH
ncbi:hypothetical protein POJ06DRAFT_256123 [Lipomyces tetrasporus]|uniref:RNA polymerase II degradation factor 1 n=1 Tax=Lipomyces tetrasporus TaxID=54092 RepID=A0AAD7QPJ7_9ASCO|nr:uncharacterized protein POJ06DRAFT_256123 [Lipomyces tetrasporus]KAJ8099148.1 hypothetical protein POJ06DRAFT_256123 [Lipomyces tetrasporus]